VSAAFAAPAPFTLAGWGGAFPVRRRSPFDGPLRSSSCAGAGAPRRRSPARADDAIEAAGGFDALVARHRDRVFRVALSVLGPGGEADAEDVAQEAFVRAYRRLGTFRGESRLGTWLYRVAFNLAVDQRRRRGRQGPTAGEEALDTLPAADGDPHRAAREGESARLVRRLLEDLPETQRAALHLHYWMGHTVAEIAELLGAAEGTVKSHLHRGRKRLRAALDAEEGSP
jgi:RNA polymerase sigma-70 factor (ECF subfamily)